MKVVHQTQHFELGLLLLVTLVMPAASISLHAVGSLHSAVSDSGRGEVFPPRFIQATGITATNDTGPPTWPPSSNLTVFKVTPTSLVLTWPNATDEVPIVAYRIYENKTLVQTVQGNITSYYARALNSAAYVFQIEAGDGTHWTTGGPSLTVNMALTKLLVSLWVPGPESVQAGTVLTFTVNATGPNVPTETVYLSSSGLPPGASFPPQASGNPISGTFSWNPISSQGPGNYTITFQASDNQKSPPVTKTVLIHVTKSRKAPVVTVPGPQAIPPGTLLSFAVVAEDPNLPPSPVNVSAAGLPRGSSFDSKTSIFSWRPTDDQAPGVYVLTFTAADENGLVTTKVTITVSSTSSVTTLPQALGADYLTYLPWILLVVVTVALFYILWLQRGKGGQQDKLLKRPIGDGVKP